jgi:flagellar hook-basal body complex protein FliE
MAIESVSPMAARIALDLAQLQNQAMSLGVPSMNESSGDSGAAGAQSFSDSLKQALQAVNDQDVEASHRMAEVDSGSSDDLVGAMLASQESSLSFSMLMQVRNKVVGAMDELIKLQL